MLETDNEKLHSSTAGKRFFLFVKRAVLEQRVLGIKMRTKNNN